MGNQQVERSTVRISHALKQDGFLVMLERELSGNLRRWGDDGLGQNADIHFKPRFFHSGMVALKDIQRFNNLLGGDETAAPPLSSDQSLATQVVKRLPDDEAADGEETNQLIFGRELIAGFKLSVTDRFSQQIAELLIERDRAVTIKGLSCPLV